MALKSGKTVDGFPVSKLTAGSERRVVLACDSCGKETTTTYSNYVRTQTPDKRGKTFCRRCAAQKSGALKKGKPIKRTGPRPNVHAEKHHSWRGGRFIASDGYVQVYLGAKKYRKEHFLIMEEHLGRVLQKEEVVHHIDGNKQNSALTNLDLMRGEREHRQAHNSLSALSYLLVQKGLIGYERKTHTYVAVGKLRELLGHPEEGNQQPSPNGDDREGSTTRRRVSLRQ